VNYSGMDTILSKFDRPIGRSLFVVPTIFLLYFLIELARVNFKIGRGLEISRSPHANEWHLFFLSMALVFAIQWVVSISGRMLALRLSRLWIIPYFVPWVIILLTMTKGSSRQVAVAIVFALAVQLPLMVLPSRPVSQTPK